MIELRSISIKKGNTIVVRDIDFRFRVGKKYVILGKNGAGKSSLLDGITGKILPFSGEILWNGKKLTEFKSDELALRRAVLSQNTTVGFPIRVYDLVEMGSYPNIKNLKKEVIDHLVKDALGRVRMTEYTERDFTTLSGGEQKRILLAKCLVQLNCYQDKSTDKFLFLDEPTSSLDISEQLEFIKLIKELADQHQIGVISILHDINLASIFADELLMIRDGRLVEAGVPDRVVTESILKKVMDLDATIHRHPTRNCPQMSTNLPF